MTTDAERRARIELLLTLARTYRGWSRRRLARALGRHAGKLVPPSGLPKADFLVALARALDWPVEDVVLSVCPDADDPTDEGAAIGDLPEEFTAVAAASRDAHRCGRFREAVTLARHATRLARSGEERAIASSREASAWDGLGRYVDALKASRRGLTETMVTDERRLVLQCNLAIEYYTLWQLLDARAMSHDLICRFDRIPPDDRTTSVTHALAYYVRGHSHRRLIAEDRMRADEHARLARADLDLAAHLLEDASASYDDPAYAAVAHTCRGGLIEAEVALGRRDPDDALAAYTDDLGTSTEPEAYAVGDWMESRGWWCICGCNVALRHLTDEREIQRVMAVFTNKADEIAERTGNWAMRERIVTLEFLRRQRLADWTDLDSDWTIDAADLRAIAGTMGRFPFFHQIGWRILRSARMVLDP